MRKQPPCSVTTQHSFARGGMVTCGRGFTPTTTEALSPELERHDLLHSGICRGLACEEHVGSNLLNLPFLIKNGSRIDHREGNDLIIQRGARMQSLPKPKANEPEKTSPSQDTSDQPKNPNDRRTCHPSTKNYLSQMIIYLHGWVRHGGCALPG